MIDCCDDRRRREVCRWCCALRQAGGGRMKARTTSAAAWCTHRAYDPPGSAPPTSCASLRRPRHRRLTARIAPRVRGGRFVRYGESPLVCPRCGNRMRVLAVITDPPRSTGFFATSSRSVLRPQGSSWPQSKSLSVGATTLRQSQVAQMIVMAHPLRFD